MKTSITLLSALLAGLAALSSQGARAQCTARGWAEPYRVAEQHAQMNDSRMDSKVERLQGGVVHATLSVPGHTKEMLEAPGRPTLYRGVNAGDVQGGMVVDFVDFGTQFALPLQALGRTFREGPCSVRGETPAFGAIPGTVEADAGRLRYNLSVRRQNTEGGAETLSMSGEFRYDGPEAPARERVPADGWMELRQGRLVPLSDEEFARWMSIRQTLEN